MRALEAETRVSEAGVDRTGPAVKMEPVPPLKTSLRTAAALFALATGAIAVLVMVGWGLDVDALRRLVPGSAAMKMNTALAFLLAAGALLLYRTGRGRRRRLLATLCSAAVMLIGLATLAEYVFGWQLGIDQLLVSDRAVAGLPYAGRPAANAASALAALGLGLVLWDVRIRRWWPTHVLATAVGVAGVLALLGYATGANSLFAVGGQRIALHSATALILLSLGVLFARPDRGGMARLTSAGPGGALLRRLFPAAIALPVLIAWLMLIGEDQRLYGHRVGAWMFATAVIAVFGALAWVFARTLERTDVERRSAEGEARKLAAIVESSGDAIVRLELDGEVVSWNAAAERLYGWSASEVTGRRLAETTVPGDRLQEHRDLLARVRRGETVQDFPAVRRRKDGSPVDTSSTFSPIRDETEAVVGIGCVARDISAEQRARRRFQALLEAAPDAMVIVDESGAIVFANEAAVRSFGYSREELVGQAVEILVPDRLRAAHPGHRASFASNPRPLQLGGGDDVRARRRDGSEFPVELSLSPLETDDGLLVTAAIRDVTERVVAEAERGRLAAIVQSSGAAIISLTAEGLIETWNEAAERLYGYSAEEAVGRSAAALLARDPAEREAVLAAVVRGGDTIQTETQDLRKDRTAVEVAVADSPIRDRHGATVGIARIARDITQQKRVESDLQFLADRDPLTGLLNRRRLSEELTRLTAYQHRYSTAGASLLVADLDNFKFVNDTLGHAAGDQLLQGIAQALEERLRESDILARLGGDEFAVLLPHTDGDAARAVADSLRQVVRDFHTTIGGREVRTTASIGIAPVGDGASAEEALSIADLAMYGAKAVGRDAVAAGRPGDNGAGIGAEIGWFERLRAGLEHDRFELHAQPIVELSTGRVRCQELLLRLRGEAGELFQPDAFIHIAERFGLIGDIDRWVVCEAIRVLAAERDGGTAFSVNLSGRSIGDRDLLALIERELTAAEVDPGRLIFEVTETAAIRDIDSARQFAEGLVDIGCSAALDDFGSGFSSFSQLKRLPVDYLKIDGDLVSVLPGGEDDRALLEAIVGVARGLHKKTVAEYVGSEEALTLLREYGVDYGQGFYLGVPEPLHVAPATH